MKQYDPAEMFWGYYDKVKQERGGIANATDEEMSKLAKFHKIMRYFMKLKLEIEELEFGVFFRDYQKKRLLKKGVL